MFDSVLSQFSQHSGDFVQPGIFRYLGPLEMEREKEIERYTNSQTSSTPMESSITASLWSWLTPSHSQAHQSKVLTKKPGSSAPHPMHSALPKWHFHGTAPAPVSLMTEVKLECF